MNDDFPHLNRFISYRVGLLRSLRKRLISRGVGYVKLDGNEQDFWIAAGRRVPYFAAALTLEEVDRVLGDGNEWRALRASIQPGDKIYPFAINVDTMAIRLGYVVLRHGKPIGGLVCVSS